jgi:hypothetical protein
MQLPIALEVTPAHVNDGEMAPSLIEKAASRTSTRFFVLDAGYDQMKVYEAARNVNAQAIIPLNLRGEKEPPAGMTSNGCHAPASAYWRDTAPLSGHLAVSSGRKLKARTAAGGNHLFVLFLLLALTIRPVDNYN